MTPLDHAIERTETVAPSTQRRAGNVRAERLDWPLNRQHPLQPWPHFNPGIWLDTNAGLIRTAEDEAWAVFTRYQVPPEAGTGSIWVVRIDAQMQPCGIPMPVIGSGIDPRVIRINERILVFYTVIERNDEGAINGASVALVEFRISAGQWTWVAGFQLPKHPIQKPLSADAQSNWEKNWVPFAIDTMRVGLIYSSDPWDVITLNVQAGEPPHLETLHSSLPIRWACGTIRGGTPPMRYDDDHLVTFFHSAQTMGSRNVYSAGACVFQKQPPYAPVLMTAEPLLLAPYRTGAHAFGWRFAGSVVFPLGCERVGDDYHLLCGRDDSQIAPFTIRQEELARRLTPPQHGPTGSVHDYRGGTGARLPLTGLLYVPDPIPGIPELPMIHFVRAIAGRGRTFVDVGSHIGFYSMGLAPGFDRVIAFEPSRFQYGWLRRNLALNAYEHVQCEHVALGDTPGSATLHVLSYEGGLNSLSMEVASGMTVLDQYDVPVQTLDSRGLTDVDLLKIDVEGFEVQVLKGAMRTIAASRPVILMEVWADPQRRREVQAVMTGMGYTMEFLFPLSPELAICLPNERRHTYQWFI